MALPNDAVPQSVVDWAKFPDQQVAWRKYCNETKAHTHEFYMESTFPVEELKKFLVDLTDAGGATLLADKEVTIVANILKKHYQHTPTAQERAAQRTVQPHLAQVDDFKRKFDAAPLSDCTVNGTKAATLAVLRYNPHAWTFPTIFTTFVIIFANPTVQRKFASILRRDPNTVFTCWNMYIVSRLPEAQREMYAETALTCYGLLAPFDEPEWTEYNDRVKHTRIPTAAAAGGEKASGFVATAFDANTKQDNSISVDKLSQIVRAFGGEPYLEVGTIPANGKQGVDCRDIKTVLDWLTTRLHAAEERIVAVENAPVAAAARCTDRESGDVSQAQLIRQLKAEIDRKEEHILYLQGARASYRGRGNGYRGGNFRGGGNFREGGGSDSQPPCAAE